MVSNWHALPEDQHPADAGTLTLTRSLAILAAAVRRTDLTIVRCARMVSNEHLIVETIVIDFACDGVPSRNAVGIDIPERIAIRIPSSKDAPIDVRALRKDFPLLLHQNAVEPGTAPSLCLYAIPQAAINRNWTSERFLRRIEEWLARSATETLHLEDQPVEQLFYATQSELVLPHDFEARRQEINAKAWGTASELRADKSATYTLHWKSAHQHPQAKLLDLVLVTLTPVVHGRPEENPLTLGQLHDMFTARGADLVGSFREAIRSRVPPSGRKPNEQDAAMMILLEVPVSRVAGGGVERVFKRAFLVKKGFLDLGQALTVLMFHEKVYYAEPGGFLKPVESNAWRDIAIEGIDVLSGLSKSMARVQSGVRDEGPTAVLVGGGSLGATMLDAWLRSGWGIWSVVDDDYLKPHNLVRHPAESWAIGLNKAITAAGRAQNLFQDANPVAAIASNGLDTENPELVKAFAAANLVVDATADLDFPRKASMTEGGPRHASAFLTPSANCSVLLVEDAGRNSKLRTLEAQYYRAILNEAWGESHLSGHRGRLWTGGGCRDKSTVMPYSAVMVHAANLAEQIRYRQVLPEACAKLWERNPNTGEVIARSLTCELESTLQVGAVLVSLDHGLIHKLRDLREAQLPLETGGILMGYHDFNLNLLVVVDACAAPVDSDATPTTFKRGIAGVKEIIDSAAVRTAGIVQYIGEWHSHPPKVSTAPSKDDQIQLLNLATLLADDGLPALSLIVGEGPELTAMLGVLA